MSAFASLPHAASPALGFEIKTAPAVRIPVVGGLHDQRTARVRPKSGADVALALAMHANISSNRDMRTH